MTYPSTYLDDRTFENPRPEPRDGVEKRHNRQDSLQGKKITPIIRACSQCLNGDWFPASIALGILLVVYAGTLQWDMSGCASGYTADVGEIQIALNLWGTIHYTGYPLFTILSALLTEVGLITGVPPAAAASAAATVWSLLGLAITYRIMWRLTQGDRGIAALVILVIGLVETFWIHSVVAEVYSFSLFLMALALLTTLRLVERWDGRDWLVLMFVLGTAVAHHRLLVLIVPCATIPTIPTLRHQRPFRLKWVLCSLIAFFVPFLAYFYLPLRAVQHSLWVYGRPDTWSGFWAQFLGMEETENLLRMPSDPQQWFANFRFLKEQLEHQLPLGVLLAGLMGLVSLTRRQFWTGIALIGTSVAFLAFIAAFPHAVWAPATLMPCLLILALGCAYILHRLATRWSPARWLAWAGLLALAGLMFRTNLPFVWSLVRDRSGRDIIQTLSPLERSTIPGEDPTVALPWGGTLFAGVYGLNVTHELDGFEIVDHRADFRSIVDRDGKILTLAFNLGNWPLEWWTNLLGEAHFSSAAPGIAMISRYSLYTDTPLQANFDLGNGVRIRDVEMMWQARNKLWVTIYWEKTAAVQSPYQVGIHLVSKDPPDSAQDVLAQANALNPVDGWYPVPLWKIGEIVRDDYMLDCPAETNPVAVTIGLYQIDQDGGFINTKWLSLDVPDYSTPD